MDHATKSARTSGQFHAVRFYENQESLCRIVAEFLGEGFVGGQPAIVIATPTHRDGIIAELRTRHFDLDNLLRAGDLLLLDAQETLDRFMIDGLPNTELFKAVGSKTIEGVRRNRTECVLRAYGEMVDLLWKEGRTVAAVRLEMLWNQLAMTHDFSLLCGYSMGNFYKDAGVGDICRQHSHVLSADGEAAPVN